MAAYTHLLATVVLLFGLIDCGNDSAPGHSTSHATNADARPSPSLAQRLLIGLDDRETWPSDGVKVWLKNPTVSATLSLPGGDPVEVHAWAGNENDFNAAMMRLNQGDTLYAITDDEFLMLKERQASAVAR